MNDNEMCKLMVETYNHDKMQDDDSALEWKRRWLKDGTSTKEQMDRCATQILWHLNTKGELPKFE